MCKSGNALIDRFIEGEMVWQCRDCGFEVHNDNIRRIYYPEFDQATRRFFWVADDGQRVDCGPLDAPRFDRIFKAVAKSENVFCFRCNGTLKIDGDQSREIYGRDGNPHCKKCADEIDRDRKVKSDRFRAMENATWQLIYDFGDDELVATTLIAKTAAEAVKLGRAELAKNPSREWYLKKWKESGERVRPSYYTLETLNGAVEIHINRGDWSGKETTLRYNPNTGVFEMTHLEGYVFWLERSTVCDEVTGAMFKIRGSQWRAEHDLGQVWEGLKRGHYSAFGMGVERDGDNPFIVAAQLLCNTI
jgi:DNA-directed RNA polymerase subunit M/transcription elongation factor TFIIS